MKKQESLKKMNDEVAKMKLNEYQEEIKLNKEETISDKKTNHTYSIAKIIGNGTFGVVFQAKVNETGEKVAIKKVFQDKRYKNRELQIIKELKHPNIVSLLGSFYTAGDEKDEVYLNLVMDYMPETLSKVIKNCYKTNQKMSNQIIKIFSYQMFRAIAYLHGSGICHRDIKPQNMLLDSERLILKLCDFGSAKKLIKGEANISYICSRYYRAPELIFGATDYTPDIDTWSVGCVIAEMMRNEPLFPGESAVDQLVEIIKILGTPTAEQVKKMNPNHNEFKFPNIKSQPWGKIFKSHVDPVGIDLISKILVYAPKERYNPLQALMHPYFNDLRVQNAKINDIKLPDLFNFTEEELLLGPELADKLIPKWYRENNTFK